MASTSLIIKKKVIQPKTKPERRKLIDSYLNQTPLTEKRFDIEYELMQYQLQFTHSYSKPEIQQVGDFYLDDIYEAKAHKWMLNNIDLNQKILFWCVGRRLTGDEVESICSR